MADQSTQSIAVAAPPADVMAVIADFPSSPEWVAAAKQVDVLETGPEGRARRVHFVLDAGAVKDDYVLEYTWEGDRRGFWDLVQGQMQKRQGGFYHLDHTAPRSTPGTHPIAIHLSPPLLRDIQR